MSNKCSKSRYIFVKNTHMDFARKQSISIDLLRFPLCILVVLCHTKILFGIPGVGLPVGTFQQGLQIFLCEVIPHIAVPAFVFFSGYLFFYNCSFDSSLFKLKFMSRARGQLLPYLIWCTIGFIIAASTGECAFSLKNFLWGFWDTRAWMDLPSHIGAAMPADMPLWFLRDLMMMTILSPVIYWIIRKTGILLPLAAGIWWYSYWMPKITGFSSDIVFFYIFGAYLAIKGVNFVEKTYKFRWLIYLTAAGLMIADFIIVNGNFTSLGKLKYCWPVFNAFVFFGMFAAVQISASFASKTERMNLKFWGGCSFFVYAVHFLYSPHLMKGLGYLWQPNSDLGFAAFFLVFAALTLLIGVSIFWVMQKLMPMTCNVLIGGRLK